MPTKLKPPEHFESRFEAFIDRDGLSGCWMWRGPVNRTGGYGMMNFGRAHRMPKWAHRHSWERTNGPIPDGLVIDHLCRVRLCVNPAHLRAVTRRENTLAPGSLARSAANAKLTHCLRGHALTPDNLKPWEMSRGWRVCKTCVRAGTLDRRARKSRVTDVKESD